MLSFRLGGVEEAGSSWRVGVAVGVFLPRAAIDAVSASVAAGGRDLRLVFWPRFVAKKLRSCAMVSPGTERRWVRESPYICRES